MQSANDLWAAGAASGHRLPPAIGAFHARPRAHADHTATLRVGVAGADATPVDHSSKIGKDVLPNCIPWINDDVMSAHATRTRRVAVRSAYR